MSVARNEWLKKEKFGLNKAAAMLTSSHQAWDQRNLWDSWDVLWRISPDFNPPPFTSIIYSLLTSVALPFVSTKIFCFHSFKLIISTPEVWWPFSSKLCLPYSALLLPRLLKSCNIRFRNSHLPGRYNQTGGHQLEEPERGQKMRALFIGELLFPFGWKVW